jgi:hypothetical protein
MISIAKVNAEDKVDFKKFVLAETKVERITIKAYV